MLVQLLLAVTGVVAILLTQSTRSDRRKYACLFGLAGQPFWFYSAYTADQWGIFVLCIFYTYAWLTGLRNHWLINKDKEGI